MRRISKLYDKALEDAQAAQRAFVLRLREVSATIRPWEPFAVREAAQRADPEAQRLAREVAIAWDTLELRRQQLLKAKAVA